MVGIFRLTWHDVCKGNGYRSDPQERRGGRGEISPWPAVRYDHRLAGRARGWHGGCKMASMTSKADKLEATADHHARLVAKFGNGKGWEYSGEVTDAGPDGQAKCACGHPIRYEYHWQHEDGRKAVTGSVCIDYIPGLSVEAVERIKAHAAAIRKAEREARKAAKVAAQVAEVVEVREQAEAALQARWGRELRMTGWLDAYSYDLRCRACSYRSDIRSAALLKTPAGQLRRLRSVIADLT